MTAFIALLRAVNVGGTGKIPMSDLKALCEKTGFTRAQTYIASGNVYFLSESSQGEVQQRLQAALNDYAQKPIGVTVRTAAEMRAVVDANPFKDQPGNRVVAIFLQSPPSAVALRTLKGLQDEQLAVGTREIYAYYPSGQGQSKLVVPSAEGGTARNLNTVAALADRAEAL